MLKLNDPSLLRDRAYIGGVWTEAANRKAVHNPANGALIAEVADVGVAGARAAIDAAAAAFPAWWPRPRASARRSCSRGTG